MHRQTKGAETDMLGLTSPRHIPTLPPDADCQRPIGALPPIGGFLHDGEARSLQVLDKALREAR
jgi:hypothetical protein